MECLYYVYSITRKNGPDKSLHLQRADERLLGEASRRAKVFQNGAGRMHHPTVTGCISWYVNYTSIEPSCLIYTAQRRESRQHGETASSCLVSGARPPHARKTKGGSAEGRCRAQARRRLATAMSSAEAQAEAKAAPSSETKAHRWPPLPAFPGGVSPGRQDCRDTGPDGSGSEAASHMEHKRSSKSHEPRDGQGSGPGAGRVSARAAHPCRGAPISGWPG